MKKSARTFEFLVDFLLEILVLFSDENFLEDSLQTKQNISLWKFTY